MVRRVPWQLLTAALLVVVLIGLATLQYRWLGEVSAAERERMRANLQTRVTAFSAEFDRELTHAYVAFHVDRDRLDADPGGTLADAVARWRASTIAPGLVRDVYLVDVRAGTTATLRRLDVNRRALDADRWPPELEKWREHDVRFGSPAPGAPLMLLLDAVDETLPGLIVGLPDVKRLGTDEHMFVSTRSGLMRAILVQFDADHLRDELITSLVTKHLGSAGTSEYLVTIARRNDPKDVIYTSTSADVRVDERNADVIAGLFDLRLDELTQFDALTAGLHPPGVTNRLAFTIVRRAESAEGKRVLMSGGTNQGRWQVFVRHRSGSLESVVASSRRRNLAISVSVLGLLAVSFLLAVASAQRQRRLARQQIEFVAAVSHELRTPLAVICSAGENLADGLVSDTAQIKRYGKLVEHEGRRLADMMERVLEFAGIASKATRRPVGDVDLTEVVNDAVAAVTHDARDRHINVLVRSDVAPHHVRGDADALRSALQNVVGNAVKYSAPGGIVEVSLANADTTIRVAVTDRGLGIDAEELPHIFKPFFRGRRAIDAQVRGTGVGLSVVRHVVDEHHGDIRVTSRAGEGTTVTIDLPAAGPAAEGARAPVPQS